MLAFILMGATILLILALQAVGPEAQLPSAVVLRVVVPQEKKGARWIRMVETIEVATLP